MQQKFTFGELVVNDIDVKKISGKDIRSLEEISV